MENPFLYWCHPVDCCFLYPQQTGRNEVIRNDQRRKAKGHHQRIAEISPGHSYGCWTHTGWNDCVLYIFYLHAKIPGKHSAPYREPVNNHFIYLAPFVCTDSAIDGNVIG